MASDLSEWLARIVEASGRIYELVQQTPVALIEDDPRLGSVRAFLKLEHLQKTGSFKLRGATNKVLSLSPEEAAKGVDYFIHRQSRIWVLPPLPGTAELTPRFSSPRRSRRRNCASSKTVVPEFAPRR